MIILAEQENADSRNADFHRINNMMPVKINELSVNKPVSEKFDLVIWSGDLNYRVNTTRKMADTLLKNEMLEVIFC